MQINEFLNSVCEQIKYKPIRNTIAEELKDHIEDKKEELIEMGQNEEEAEKNAVEQMGDAEIIGKELNKVHRPSTYGCGELVVNMMCLALIFAVYRKKDVNI